MTAISSNATQVTMNPAQDVLDRASLLIEGDRIAGLGTASLSAQAPHAEVIDLTGRS